jgi:hypothetical protein
VERLKILSLALSVWISKKALLYSTIIKKLNNMNKEFVKTILDQHGFTEEFYDEGIESGSEDWMDVVNSITGEDPYKGLSEEGGKKTWEFIVIMGDMGIELW